MPRRLELVGKKFFKLKVIKFSRIKKNSKGDKPSSYFLCKCDCGNIKEIQGSQLISGQKSCGCYKPPRLNAYKIDKDYFKKINTEDKAYFFGFIATDGYIGNHIDQKVIRLELQKSDKEILNTFRKFLKTKKPITYIKRKNKLGLSKTKYFESYALSILNVKMRDDLINKGIGNKKSYNIEFPNNKIVPHRLVRHYIRGVFDGDGSISVAKGQSSPICDFISGSNKFLIGFKKYLEKYKIKNVSIYKNLRTSPVSDKKYNVFNLRIHPSMTKFETRSVKGKQGFQKIKSEKRFLNLKLFFNLIYKNSNKKLMLTRKYKKFKEVLV